MAPCLECLARPEFGSTAVHAAPRLLCLLFFVATALFLPGVFGIRLHLPPATRRFLPRLRPKLVAFYPPHDHRRHRDGNLRRIAVLALNAAIVKKAAESTNELLPFEFAMTGLAIIFLVMTTLRIWFDLAEADTVLNDQRAVRKSIGAGFRHTFRSLGRLLASYIVDDNRGGDHSGRRTVDLDEVCSRRKHCAGRFW